LAGEANCNNRWLSAFGLLQYVWGRCQLLAFLNIHVSCTVNCQACLDLFVYINNCFSYDDATSLAFYPLYQCSFPTKQTCLLSLWDELGIPHDCHKQEFGHVLRIISFQVDITAMVISMDHADRE
jgi:hypothetical protein